MALTMNCINVFYQLNDFILVLSMYEEFLIENSNNKQFNLFPKSFNIKIKNL